MGRRTISSHGMGRKKINDEQMPARFPAGTLKRIDTVLGEKENRSDLIRRAVERELQDREKKAHRRAARRAKPAGAEGD